MATSNAATNYLERRLLHYIFKNDSLSFSTPGDSIYVGLATAVSAAETGSLTEASYTNYARQQVAASAWTTIGGTTTITHVFIADAVSSGNILFVGQLDASKAIAEGDIFRINATNLTVELK